MTRNDSLREGEEIEATENRTILSRICSFEAKKENTNLIEQGRYLGQGGAALHGKIYNANIEDNCFYKLTLLHKPYHKT